MDCWVIHHPPLDFHGAGGRGCRPWPCQRVPSSRTGADGPQAEERAIAADAHRIARVPCDEFLFFVFLAEALKKNTVCPVVKKRSRQIAKCMFLFEQSSDRRNDSSDGGGKASHILEKLEIYGDGPPDSALQFPRRSVPYFASMLIEAFSHVQFVPLTPK